MNRNHKVGTFSAGIVLIVLGMLFMLKTFGNILDYAIILSLWPVILILLGIEILISYFIQKEEKLKYDGGAIFIVIILTLFSMFMAFSEVFIREFPNIRQYL